MALSSYGVLRIIENATQLTFIQQRMVTRYESGLVLCQPLKLGLNCICTTDFQSVGGNLCRRTGSPSYPKIEP